MVCPPCSSNHHPKKDQWWENSWCFSSVTFPSYWFWLGALIEILDGQSIPLMHWKHEYWVTGSSTIVEETQNPSPIVEHEPDLTVRLLRWVVQGSRGRDSEVQLLHNHRGHIEKMVSANFAELWKWRTCSIQGALKKNSCISVRMASFMAFNCPVPLSHLPSSCMSLENPQLPTIVAEHRQPKELALFDQQCSSLKSPIHRVCPYLTWLRSLSKESCTWGYLSKNNDNNNHDWQLFNITAAWCSNTSRGIKEADL